MNYESAIKKYIYFKKKYVISTLENRKSFEQKHDLLLHEITSINTIKMILIEAGSADELFELIKEWELEVRQMQDDLFKTFM
jgi:hypothetical protein